MRPRLPPRTTPPAGTRLGQAIGEKYETGKGWVQHFAGTPSGEPAVICALYGRSAMAVAESVWDEVCAIGGGHPGGGTEGAGFPVGSQPKASFIGPASKEVELAGGQWGPAACSARAQAGGLEARYRIRCRTTSDRDSWGTGKGDMDLRVRLAARIPVAAAACDYRSRARADARGSALRPVKRRPATGGTTPGS